MHRGIYRSAYATPSLVIVIIIIIIRILSISLTASSGALVQADRAQLELFRSNACRATLIDITASVRHARRGS